MAGILEESVERVKRRLEELRERVPLGSPRGEFSIGRDRQIVPEVIGGGKVLSALSDTASDLMEMVRARRPRVIPEVTRMVERFKPEGIVPARPFAPAPPVVAAPPEEKVYKLRE